MEETDDDQLALTKRFARASDRRFVRVYDSITHGLHRWTILEALRGESMSQLISTRGKRPASQAAEIVHLRYFAGLTGEQAAEAVGVSPRKADSLWEYARAWLLEKIEDGEHS